MGKSLHKMLNGHIGLFVICHPAFLYAPINISLPKPRLYILYQQLAYDKKTMILPG